MYLSCRSIPLNSINYSVEWNLHPWDARTIPPDLQEDLALNGIIRPPVVIADSANTFTVVSGARRIEFARRFPGSSQIDCMVLDKNAPHSFILHLILTDQSCTSSLSLAEKARFVELACRFLKMEDVAAIFQTKLQLKKGRSAIPDLLRILAQDEEIIREVHAGRLQDRMVAEIFSLQEADDRLTLIRLFRNLGMGDGKQKRFFNLIRDIAFRQGSSIAAYLRQKEITAILDHQEMNIPQKIDHLGNKLQQDLAPSSTQAEEVFIKQVKSLQLPANHALSHSPSFEKDEITLAITFKNFAECEQYLRKQQLKR